MNRRPLLLLAGTAALAAGGAVLLGPRTPPAPDAGGAPLMFQNLANRLAGAARIEIRQGAQSLVVVRRDAETWVLPERQNYPVRPEKLRELLVGLTELRLSEPRTADAAMLGRLGLDEPGAPGSTAALLRVLDDANGAIAELVVGRRRIHTQGNVPESVYVRRPGEAQSWLAEGRLPLDADPQLWIDRGLANLARERVLTVQATRPGAPPLGLVRGEGPDGALRVGEPAQAPALDSTSLDEVGRAFEFLTLTEARPAAGLEGPVVAETRFGLTDDLAVTVTAQRQGEATWLRLAAAGDDEAARLNAIWRGWAYQVSDWKLKALLPRLEELRQAAPPPAPAP